ncbi:MAG: LarC family nickel insertion protein, partial [Tissierellia bacterium]|nr:LarC family nickel insertion protein [Tissierellia bacterium]
HDHGHHSHRSLTQVLEIIQGLDLEPEVEDLAKKIFTILGQAEAKIHGKSLEDIHFHEVGELDSIMDCVLGAYLLKKLGVDEVVASAVNPGSGQVLCAHGTYPLPAPAALEILTQAQIPLGEARGHGELTTPTGAALLAAICQDFQKGPQGRPLATGYGAGSKNPSDLPNVLRAILLEKEEGAAPLWYSCNVDDMTGEELGFLMDRLFEAGARDVTFTPLMMKKNRPGHRIDVLTDPSKKDRIRDILLTHSSSLGLKLIHIDKLEMARSFENLGTQEAPLRKKIGTYGTIKKASFEYEDLKRKALAENTSLRQALEEALKDQV